MFQGKYIVDWQGRSKAGISYFDLRKKNTKKIDKRF